jgi:acid phosphatase type 7
VVRTSAVVVLAVLAVLPPAAVADPVVMAAGDIACDPDDPGYNGGAGTATRCRQQATSDLVVAAAPDLVLPLGDIQYNSASTANINAVYAPTWGRVRSISRPVIGNHEGAGTGYFDYFNGKGVLDGPAGPRGKGYYSFDLGAWHLVALNSNCSRVSCSAGSEQERWLRADLAAHPSLCTVAYWHDPRFSSGHGGSSTSLQPFWEALHEANADLVLSASSHDYERFAPLDVNGDVDPARGIRQFVVGTGGVFFTGGLDSRAPHSEVAQNTVFGVLRLTLHPTGYDWQFVPEAGKSFSDSGSEQCHDALPLPQPGPAPLPDLTAPVISRLRLAPRPIGRKSKFRYRLTEAATVTFTIRRCRRVSCRRYKRAGRFRQLGAAGLNERPFRAKIRRRRLRPGSFRAVLVARDAAGNRSRSASVAFRVIRRPR